MTTIPILSGDFEILMDDERTTATPVLGMKTVRRASGATATVYSTNALYSAIADAADDFIAMGFENPMLPVTPNAYTMENMYFIDRRSTEWLSGGAIDADWTISGTSGIVRKPYTAGTGFVDGDRGREVTESASGDTGTLLDYEVEPDGTLVLWIRPEDASTMAFDSVTGTIGVTGDGGTGVSGTLVAGMEATNGQSLWPSIQAIGAVPAGTEVYLVQDRQKITDWEGNFQWWTTDNTVSLGIIDILIRVVNAGATIADGDVEVFGRRYTSLYDNFRLNIVAGGRSALPLASAPDINNTTGYRTTGTLSTVTGTFTVGNGIYQGATWATATARGVITETNTNTDLEYYLVGDLTDLSSTTSTQEYDFVTQADGDADATTGTVGINLTGPTDTAAGEGGTVTITQGAQTGIDHDGNGTNEFYSVTVDAQGPGANGVTAAKVYERIKYATRRGATAADLFATPTNMTGEQYRGLDGQFEYDANTGTLGAGEDLFTTTGGNTWTAKLGAQQTTASPTYITVMDQQTSLDSVVNDNVIEDEAGTEDVTVHTGTVGLNTFTSPKASPFGTFTGTVIFGARGIAYTGFHDDDTQNYILTDDGGAILTPPNTVTFSVTNTIAGDNVYVARDTGTAGVIDKDQFGGIDTPAASYNRIGDAQLRVAGSTDVQVPPAGYVRVIVDPGGVGTEEHTYVYDSRTVASNGVFNLRVVDDGDGIADATTSSVLLVNAGAAFDTVPKALPGMLVQNTTASPNEVYEVVSVDNDTQLTIKPLYGGTTFTTGNTFEINTVIGHSQVPADYDTGDDIHDLILDVEADATTMSNTFVKTLAANFDVVVNVRRGETGGIIPFTANPTVNDAGGSAATVRTTDTIHS